MSPWCNLRREESVIDHLQVIPDHLQAIEDVLPASFSLKGASKLLQSASDGESSGVVGAETYTCPQHVGGSQLA